MADISNVPVQDYGNILYSIPQAQSNIASQTAQQQVQKAEVPLIGAQTQGIQLQNAMAGMKLEFLHQMMQQAPQVPNPLQGQQQGDSSIMSPSTGDPLQDEKNAIISHANQKYQPYIWSPSMQAQFNQLQMRDNISGAMGIPTNYAAMYRGQFDSANQQRQEQAWNDYQMFNSAAKYGYDGLSNFEQGKFAAQLKKEGFSDDDIKDLAAHIAPKAYIYSGREAKVNTQGVVVDDKTQQPIPGMGRLAMSLTEASKQADTKQTWQVGNHEQTGTEAQFLGYNRQTYIDKLTHDGEEPPPMPGSPAALQAAAKKQASAGPTAGGPTAPVQGAATAGNTPDPLAGLAPEQADFVRNQPQGPYSRPPGNQALNSQDQKDYDAYTAQRSALIKESGLAQAKAQNTLANTTRIQNLLSLNPNLGPGSKEYTQMQTIFANWFGSPQGQPAAQQVLSKFLSAEQMNDMLAKFHGEGAQVRLGAYESRLIMEQLAANPQMTKTAINQMLDWSNSDSKYEITKAQTASALTASAGRNGKYPDLGNFDNNYEARFPRISNVQVQPTKIQEANNPIKPMPEPAKLKAYADQKFGGDIAKATAYLKSHNYGQQ